MKKIIEVFRDLIALVIFLGMGALAVLATYEVTGFAASWLASR